MNSQPAMDIDWLDPFRQRDISHVLTIFQQSFHDPWAESRLCDLVRFPGVQGILARIDGLICGCLLYRCDGRLQEILTLGVLADARRLGVAARLILRAKMVGLGTNITVAPIHASNEPARRCFEKAGFEFAVTVTDFFGKGDDADLYSWDRPEPKTSSSRRKRKKT